MQKIISRWKTKKSELQTKTNISHASELGPSQEFCVLQMLVLINWCFTILSLEVTQRLYNILKITNILNFIFAIKYARRGFSIVEGYLIQT